MSKKRLNAGLVINCFADDYTAAICKGASLAAEEFDCNLFIFPGRPMDEPGKTKSEQINMMHHNTIFSYASDKNLDFLVIPLGILFTHSREDEMRSFLEGFGDLPIITVSAECPGYCYIRYDCRPGLSSVLNHVIKHHDCRKVAFIAGPEGHSVSDERVAVYRECLKENGIAYNENLVFHGTFSDRDADRVEGFLTRLHFDVEAICCANDASACSVYEALRRHDLQPGKDIIVTGYDNVSFASSCVPSLTTVSANVYDTGYRAVVMGVEAVRDGKKLESMFLPSSPLIRESCCGAFYYANETHASDSITLSDIDAVIDDLSERMNPEMQMLSVRFFNVRSRRFLRKLFSEVTSPNVKQLSMHNLIDRFRLFCQSDAIDSITICYLSDFLAIVQDAALSAVTDSEKEKQLYSLFLALHRLIVNTANTINYSLSHDIRNGLYFSGGVFKNLDHTRNDPHSAIISILNSLATMGIRSSYLYFGESPIEIKKPSDVRPYNSLQLVAYHNGNMSRTLFDEKFTVDRYEIFDNRFIDNSQRRTVIVASLFSSREQYGIVTCDIASYQFLDFFQTIINQVGFAVETAHLLDRLNIQLSAAENENQLLSAMATRDALTGIYNRLGFFERAGGAIVSPLNKGRHGFMIFADVDCLKYINDNFSHDDGDFALHAVSDALSECLGTSGIVGRIGGDEFVALWITDSNEDTQTVYNRVKKCIKHRNSVSGKAYPISASLGVYDFVCCEGLILQDLIDEADRLLYNDKPNKPNVSSS